MTKTTRLPARFREGTKYVLEARGRTVRRYIEFPDGSRLELRSRQAATCHCMARHDLEPRAETWGAEVAA